MIIAIKVNVAFQTIDVTSNTSVKSTTPKINAMMAPPHADHPIDNPFGCQMTSTSVTKKIKDANIANFYVQPSIFNKKFIRPVFLIVIIYCPDYKCCLSSSTRMDYTSLCFVILFLLL